MENEKKNSELKHLGFARMAAIQALICVSNLYDYAKQNSGPLRSTFGAVERAVTAVVNPVCQKFKDVPDDLLVFLDKKVDEGTRKFDKHAPAVAKQAVNQAQSLLQVASQKVLELVHEASVGGPRAAVRYAATESRHFALTQSVKVWIKLNRFPVVHKVADVATPTAAHWSEKYNYLVKDMAQKGYRVFAYVPLVPIDEIAKAYKQYEAEKKENGTEHKHDDSSDSD
ncbi:REF/SRPP-like protein At1g67360 isoform X2 [Manihot esculenta]|uniref:REF/SRPP-like protein n=3 Tax=Manihot esculenta TaxID=3983 RepID=A0A2C9USJ1_MANES|nr:REF/SRPP-like protein At1g67360 isoform X2 [Manihot esculenta]KAG8641615.1 hypothetical protein MANES_12G011500v8 [Manihot esculenta]OAY34317.1 hypothetical protein MANES_12G011500v8 [Manihot esculenta]